MADTDFNSSSTGSTGWSYSNPSYESKEQEDKNIQNTQASGGVERSGQNALKKTEAGIVFQAIQTMITALSSLNNYLQAFSNSVLQADLKADNEYADQISALVLIPEGASITDSKKRRSISTKNQNILLQNQVIQARLKAHQNAEQMDIQDASSTTTNSQQLTSIISAMFQTSSQILQSILGMNR